MNKEEYNEQVLKIHKKLCEEIHDLCTRKNKDYGSSAHDSYIDFGIISYVIRLSDKINRLKNLVKSKEQKVKDESIEDTLKDLANYSLLALADLRMENK